MSIYTRDWKPSELEPGSLWFVRRGDDTTVMEMNGRRQGLIPGVDYALADGYLYGYELGPRIDPPREDGETVEVRIPVDDPDPLEDLVREYLSELDNPCPDYAMRHVYRERMRKMVEPIPAPQPDIEIEGEVRDA